MPPEQPLPTGLKPTLRQLTIVVLWAALLLSVVRMSIRWGLFGNKPEMVCINVATFLSTGPMILLGLLLLILDRRSPVRVWYFGCCWGGSGILSGIAFLLVDPVCLGLTGHPTLFFPLFPLTGVFCLVGSVMHLRIIWPARCSRCGHRSVIASGRTLPDRSADRRNSIRGWCAICGQTYWKPGGPVFIRVPNWTEESTVILRPDGS